MTTTDEYRSDEEITGRKDLNDVEAILTRYLDPGDSHGVHHGGDTVFTWAYERKREPLNRLYEKAKTSQWNGSVDLDWSLPVDQESVADHMAQNNPETLFLKQLSVNDPSSPLHNWSDDEYRTLAFESQTYLLSQFLHGEQGALICAAKLVEQAPWIEAKYYASSQVMDEARHVEVFARYLDEKLEGEYAIASPLAMLLDGIIEDEAWDKTYLGMQIMVEGIALAAFSLMRQISPDPLLQDLLKYVMSDEARHVAFGVISLKEAYQEMTEAEIRERQEYAFETGLLARDRQFPATLYEQMGVDPARMLEWYLANVPSFTSGLLFSKVVPNIKKLGLLDAGAKPGEKGWLRKKYEEIEVIQYEDWVDTEQEYATFDAVNGENAEAS